MNMLFTKVDGTRVKSVIQHTRDIIKNHPGDVKIHIGTDSQNKAEYTKYSTVIAYRFDNKGVHYIMHNQNLPRNDDMFSRLWKEAELSIKVAEFLSENMPNLDFVIDMDFNSDENYDSHKLVAGARGWAVGMGYKVNLKPNDQCATRAADHQCR